jgi:hypothetical protein
VSAQPHLPPWQRLALLPADAARPLRGPLLQCGAAPCAPARRSLPRRAHGPAHCLRQARRQGKERNWEGAGRTCGACKQPGVGQAPHPRLGSPCGGCPLMPAQWRALGGSAEVPAAGRSRNRARRSTWRHCQRVPGGRTPGGPPAAAREANSALLPAVSALGTLAGTRPTHLLVSQAWETRVEVSLLPGTVPWARQGRFAGLWLQLQNSEAPKGRLGSGLEENPVHVASAPSMSASRTPLL